MSKQRLVLRDSSGRKIASVGNDAKNEAYLLLHLNAEKDSMFHVDARLSIGDTQLVQGWVHKQRELIIYVRNYEAPVVLYSKPSVRTKPQGHIYDSSDPVTVVGCFGDWLRVVVRRAGKPEIRGWIAPEKQCANPYSTCN